MVELWAQYGRYIILGALVFFMFRMHSRGGGCCGGHAGRQNSEEGSQEGNENKGCH